MDLISSEVRVSRGERSGSIICHTCNDNREGFCNRFSKWCSSVRYICEPKEVKPTKVVLDEKPGDTWRRLYGQNYYENTQKERQ